MINFFLTRHGETQWNKIGKLQGQLDSPLTKKGYRQAHAIAKQLSDCNINLIVSSTLTRAKKTADICQLSLNCSLLLTPTLIERDFGHWQGKLIEEVKNADDFQAIFHQVSSTAPPYGESGVECATRLKQALINIATDVVNTHSNILVVSHGDILRCFLSATVNGFLDNRAVNTQNKAFDNGCVFQVNYNIQQQCFTLTAIYDITQSPFVALTQ